MYEVQMRVDPLLVAAPLRGFDLLNFCPFNTFIFIFQFLTSEIIYQPGMDEHPCSSAILTLPPNSHLLFSLLGTFSLDVPKEAGCRRVPTLK